MGMVSSELLTRSHELVSTGFLRKRGGLWQAVVKVREPDGEGGYRWVQRSCSTGVRCDGGGDGGYEAATAAKNRWRDELLVEAVLRMADEVAEERVAEATAPKGDPRLQEPFGDYCREYVERRMGMGLIEPETAVGYQSLIRRYVDGPLGDKCVADVTTEDVEDVIVAMVDRGLSGSTKKKAFNLIKAALSYACDHDGLERNPCTSVKAPEASPPRQNALSLPRAAEVLDLLAGMRATGPVTAARLALLTGLGDGEVCGLQWATAGIDGSGTIGIYQSVSEAKAGAPRLKGPKNRHRIRQIPLTPAACAVLEDRWDEAVREWGEAGAGMPTMDDFVVGTPGGNFLRTETLAKEWRTIASTHDIRGERGELVRFYDLRHTFTTMLMSADAGDANPRDAQAVMGHSTPMMTLGTYTSTNLAAQEASMLRMERAIEEARDDGPGRRAVTPSFARAMGPGAGGRR